MGILGAGDWGGEVGGRSAGGGSVVSGRRTAI